MSIPSFEPPPVKIDAFVDGVPFKRLSDVHDTAVAPLVSLGVGQFKTETW
jgi:hypothetical protein